jgi:4-methoxybenzoate monooxygenase (O-demethylating)
MGALGEAAVLTANKGIAQCLGQMVARLEGELVLEALLPKIRSIRLAGPPVRRVNNTLHALASLPVEVEAA